MCFGSKEDRAISKYLRRSRKELDKEIRKNEKDYKKHCKEMESLRRQIDYWNNYYGTEEYYRDKENQESLDWIVWGW